MAYELIYGLYRYLTQRDEFRILIVGLDGSGKTALMERWRHAFDPLEEDVRPPLPARRPTVGLNIARLDYGGRNGLSPVLGLQAVPLEHLTPRKHHGRAPSSRPWPETGEALGGGAGGPGGATVTAAASAAAAAAAAAAGPGSSRSSASPASSSAPSFSSKEHPRAHAPARPSGSRELEERAEESVAVGVASGVARSPSPGGTLAPRRVASRSEGPLGRASRAASADLGELGLEGLVPGSAPSRVCDPVRAGDGAGAGGGSRPSSPPAVARTPSRPSSPPAVARTPSRPSSPPAGSRGLASVAPGASRSRPASPSAGPRGLGGGSRSRPTSPTALARRDRRSLSHPASPAVAAGATGGAAASPSPAAFSATPAPPRTPTSPASSLPPSSVVAPGSSPADARASTRALAASLASPRAAFSPASLLTAVTAAMSSPMTSPLTSPRSGAGHAEGGDRAEDARDGDGRVAGRGGSAASAGAATFAPSGKSGKTSDAASEASKGGAASSGAANGNGRAGHAASGSSSALFRPARRPQPVRRSFFAPPPPRVVLWDLGGAAALRTLWETYYSGAHAVAFVVDASAPKRFDEAKKALWAVAAHADLRAAPILVLVNHAGGPWTRAARRASLGQTDDDEEERDDDEEERDDDDDDDEDEGDAFVLEKCGVNGATARTNAALDALRVPDGAAAPPGPGGGASPARAPARAAAGPAQAPSSLSGAAPRAIADSTSNAAATTAATAPESLPADPDGPPARFPSRDHAHVHVHAGRPAAGAPRPATGSPSPSPPGAWAFGGTVPALHHPPTADEVALVLGVPDLPGGDRPCRVVGVDDSDDGGSDAVLAAGLAWAFAHGSKGPRADAIRARNDLL